MKCFKCNQCHESFTFPGNLQTHMKRHTEASKYSCSLCEISYPQFNTLLKHLKANHNKIVRYECSECDRNRKTNVTAAIYTSTSYQNFITHKRTHKSYRFNVKDFNVHDYSIHDQ